jgi:hypothetical protein
MIGAARDFVKSKVSAGKEPARQETTLPNPFYIQLPNNYFFSKRHPETELTRSRWLRSVTRVLSEGFNEIPRKQFVDPVGRLFCDARKDVSQIALGIDSV